MRTFIPQTYEVRLHLRAEIGVVDANNHALLADTGVAMEDERTHEEGEVTLQVQSITEALSRPDFPKMYANGFTLVHSDSDSSLVFMEFGRPIAIVQFSNTILKELADKTGKAIEEMEAVLGAPVPRMEDLQRVRHHINEKRQTQSDDS